MNRKHPPTSPMAESFGSPESTPLPGFLAAVNSVSRDHLSGKEYTRQQVYEILHGLVPRFATGFAVLRKVNSLPPEAITSLAKGCSTLGPAWTFDYRLPSSEGLTPKDGVVLLFEACVPESAVDWPWTVAKNLDLRERWDVFLVPGSAFTLLGAWRVDIHAKRLSSAVRRDLWGTEMATSPRPLTRR